MIVKGDSVTITPRWKKILRSRLRKAKGIHSTFRDEQGREFIFNYHVDRQGDFSVVVYGDGESLTRSGEWFDDDSHIHDVLTYHQWMMEPKFCTLAVGRWLMACFLATKQLRGLRKAPAIKRKG